MVLVRVDVFVCFFVCVRVYAWVDCSLCCSFVLRRLAYLLIVWCCLPMFGILQGLRSGYYV